MCQSLFTRCANLLNVKEDCFIAIGRTLIRLASKENHQSVGKLRVTQLQVEYLDIYVQLYMYLLSYILNWQFDFDDFFILWELFFNQNQSYNFRRTAKSYI